MDRDSMPAESTSFLEAPNPDQITLADRPAERDPPTWLLPHPKTFKNYSCCPWSSTVIMVDPETNRPILVPVTCKRWGCAYCAPRKIRRLAFLTNGANPNRLLTLTVDPSLYSTPQNAWEQTTSQVPELMRLLRKDYGECEYLRVCELHDGRRSDKTMPDPSKAKGFPHYHLMVRSAYLPQKELSERWAKLTGARIVDVRKITQSFSTFRYLTKYLTKLHRIEWTDRHVSYSKQFFNPEDTEKLIYAKREVIERSDDHPWKYLSDHYPDTTVGLDKSGFYFLPFKPGMPLQNWLLEDFDLRIPTQRATEPSKEQQRLNGVEADGYGDYDF